MHDYGSKPIDWYQSNIFRSIQMHPQAPATNLSHFEAQMWIFKDSSLKLLIFGLDVKNDIFNFYREILTCGWLWVHDYGSKPIEWIQRNIFRSIQMHPQAPATNLSHFEAAKYYPSCICLKWLKSVIFELKLSLQMHSERFLFTFWLLCGCLKAFPQCVLNSS